MTQDIALLINSIMAELTVRLAFFSITTHFIHGFIVFFSVIFPLTLAKSPILSKTSLN